ncbi:MAG: acyltransferase [Cytophagaceae bacterium]|jgi:peptidoglycan/LPS O-acetylase OafA/YrhL|nr:acyltransferase [Cytophagaceae bacterium]
MEITDSRPKTKKQIDWLAILRGSAVFLVTVFHATQNMKIDEVTAQYIDNFNDLFIFRMPLFFFISGYLLYHTKIRKNGSFGSIVRERIPRIVIPYIVITMSVYFAKLAAEMYTNFDSEAEFSVKEIINIFLFPSVDSPWVTLWFLNTVLIFFLCYPLLKISLKNIYTASLTLLILAVLHYVFFPGEKSVLDISQVFIYFLFFYFGIFFARFGLLKYITALFAVAGFILMAAGMFAYHFFEFEYFYLPYSLLGITVFIYLALLCEKTVPTLFSSFRKYYYQIYLLGMFFQTGVRVAYNLAGNENLLFVSVLLSIIFGLYGPVLVCKIAERLKWKPLLRILGF